MSKKPRNTGAGGGDGANGELPVAAAEALPEADSAELLRVTLSSIGDGVITTDDAGRVTFLNPVAQELTGWTQAEAEGAPLQDVFRIVNEDTRAEVSNPALRALRDGVIVGLANHTLLIARDGTERQIDDSAAPIRNGGGQTAGAVLVFRDITERRAIEQTIHDSEMRYRRLFQTAKDGILILDAITGKIIDANAFMSALVGLEPDELLGKELHDIGMFADTEESKRVFRELQQNRYVRFEHLPVQNQRGDRVEVEFIANVYPEDHRLVAQCNVRDISQRVAMERKIKEQAAALADESHRKDEFLAMLSHELRNPLAPIRSAAHLLKTQERGTENLIQQQAREVIERQVTNLTKLVSDLLEVSRVVSGRIRLNLQLLDLKQAVHHAMDAVAPMFQQRRHAVVLTACDEPVWVQADPTRMDEILVNLLSNAAKYTPDGGRIDMHCEHVRGENHAVVRVRDNGVGIDPAMLEGGRIFDLFTQADRSLDRATGGLGIGLSLVHRLVLLHGGTVEAKSEGEGTGSEFIIRLPLVAVPQLAPALAAPATDHPSGGNEGRRALLIDDNIDLVMMLAASLRSRGYSVQSAYTGPDGLEVAQQWRPDVVVMDIGLPGLDGYEIARRLRADPTSDGIRLIAVTGYGRDADVTLSREAGFDAHVVKPCDFDELEQLMAAPR
jgi:PAS domain S-box-containing protein